MPALQMVGFLVLCSAAIDRLGEHPNTKAKGELGDYMEDINTNHKIEKADDDEDLITTDSDAHKAP